jgi:hypothetical protein
MRKLTAALGIAIAVGGATVFGASPASAISGCSTFLIDTDTVGARCTSSAGWGRQVRAIAECRRAQTASHDVYGAWVGVNQTSVADCGGGWYAVPGPYILRS